MSHHPELPATFAQRLELEELHETLADTLDLLHDILDKLDDIHETLRGV